MCTGAVEGGAADRFRLTATLSCRRVGARLPWTAVGRSAGNRQQIRCILSCTLCVCIDAERQ
jgi:hypothetical protein